MANRIFARSAVGRCTGVSEYKHVEMIVDYIRNGSDYQYSDNHGILTRCRDCQYFDGKEETCQINGCFAMENDYCSWARRKKEQERGANDG